MQITLKSNALNSPEQRHEALRRRSAAGTQAGVFSDYHTVI